jgi:hypothetical protein
VVFDVKDERQLPGWLPDGAAVETLADVKLCQSIPAPETGTGGLLGILVDAASA